MAFKKNMLLKTSFQLCESQDLFIDVGLSASDAFTPQLCIYRKSTGFSFWISPEDWFGLTCRKKEIENYFTTMNTEQKTENLFSILLHYENDVSNEKCLILEKRNDSYFKKSLPPKKRIISFEQWERIINYEVSINDKLQYFSSLNLDISNVVSAYAEFYVKIIHQFKIKEMLSFIFSTIMHISLFDESKLYLDIKVFLDEFKNNSVEYLFNYVNSNNEIKTPF